ncbi:MAG: urease accessory UreF family protein, partial [Pseudomonadota bacterium]
MADGPSQVGGAAGADAETASPGAAQTALLLAWFSPAFPVGAFAWSHGLEQAVEAGAVEDAGALRVWTEALLRHGTGWSDALLLCAAWRAPDDPAPAETAAA